ncbi:MAG TPA: hypothetical protein PLH72_16145 [Vicinamibacterales bacterium]|nr:hypothetical protein [Vicinamibacterales bacterium]
MDRSSRLILLTAVLAGASIAAAQQPPAAPTRPSRFKRGRR